MWRRFAKILNLQPLNILKQSSSLGAFDQGWLYLFILIYYIILKTIINVDKNNKNLWFAIETLELCAIFRQPH